MREAVSHSAERTVRLRCDCGNWLEARTEMYRVGCECGRVFAVTVTDIGRDGAWLAVGEGEAPTLRDWC